MFFFARRGNEAINQWLTEHPVVVGVGALVFAAIFIVLGVRALQTGRAPSKRGKDLEGGQAKAMAIVWLVVGAFCLFFGLYKMVAG